MKIIREETKILEVSNFMDLDKERRKDLGLLIKDFWRNVLMLTV